MKKYISAVLLFICSCSLVYAQGEATKKGEKLDTKMEKNSTQMQKAERAGNGKRSIRELHKMERKEARMNKKNKKLK